MASIAGPAGSIRARALSARALRLGDRFAPALRGLAIGLALFAFAAAAEVILTSLAVGYPIGRLG